MLKNGKGCQTYSEILVL